MKVSVARTLLLACLLLIGTALPSVLAGESPGAPAKPAAKGDDGEKTASEPEEEPDPFAVPDGTPEELLKYAETVSKLRPEGIRNQREYMEFVAKGRQALLQTADKILAAHPTDEQYEKAAEIKLAALAVLAQLKIADTEKPLADFVEQLTKAGKDKLARTGKGILLNAEVSRAATPESLQKLFAEVKEFVSSGPITRSEARLVMSIGRALEYGDNPQLAAAAYKDFAALTADNKDEAIAELSKKFAGSARRLALPGNSIDIEGYTHNGDKFDWLKFQKGKVVLIDFWATWCGWCIREIPEMKELYEAYHDRGFEIVGISGDEDPEALTEFLGENDIPWTILYGKDGPSPTIEYYGISGFPTMLLVNQEGKVVSLHARGPELRKGLKQLLGPIKDKEEGEDAAAGETTKKERKAKGKKAKREKPEAAEAPQE